MNTQRITPAPSKPEAAQPFRDVADFNGRMVGDIPRLVSPFLYDLARPMRATTQIIKAHDGCGTRHTKIASGRFHFTYID